MWGNEQQKCGRCYVSDVMREEHELGQHENVQKICPQDKVRIQVLLALLTHLRPCCPSPPQAPPEPKKKASSNPYYEVGKAPSASASAAAMVDQTRSASTVGSLIGRQRLLWRVHCCE